MRTMVKEVLGPGDAIRALERDFEHRESKCLPYSVDDQRFIDLQRASIHVNLENHIEMPLPFKGRPVLPNNMSMAMK
ncbi:hypothetical protein HOLleu_17277 [Holothuria leucospilota]|uniref:Uncharacterized protein n=1 Tax=Holothuria leucospilota TaxID=206669 RepID=A0A9Q1C5A5_HOLLE|nr:hypothetical protein HOLleu_17277 [Holothuria leucospilota]